MKIGRFAIVAAAALCLLTGSAFAAEVQMSYSFKDTLMYYVVRNNEVVIENIRGIQDNWSAFKNTDNIAGAIELPTKIDGKPVAGIGTKAFLNCSKMTSLVVPEGIRNIASYAFQDCSKLTSISFPSSITNIGEWAFKNCSELTHLKLDVTGSLSIGAYAGINCSGLTNLAVHAASITIGNQVFYYGSPYYFSSNLTKIKLNATDNVTLGSYAFYQSSNLKSVDIDAKTCAFGDYAFQYCYSLPSFDIPVGTTNIGSKAFASCTALEEIAVPSSVKTIGGSAFAGCTSLTNADLEATGSLGELMFSQCSALESIAISTNVTAIGDQCFYDCEKLKSVTIPKSVVKIGSDAFSGCSDLGDVSFVARTNTLCAIGDYAFVNCNSLTNMAMAEVVSSLGVASFFGCKALKSIALPKDFTVITNNLFGNCTSLASVTFPTNLAMIGETAFNACSNLVEFTLPSNIVSIGTDAFLDTGYWVAQPDGVVEKDGYYLGLKGTPSRIVLPSGCKTITASMFEGMTNLIEVVATNVTSVGARAFAGTGLRELSLPKATTLGNDFCRGCSNLVTVQLSEELEAIPDYAFYQCPSLLKMDIPPLVTSIGQHAFDGCAALKTVTGAEGVVTVGDFAFSGCVSLEPFAFAQDVTYGVHVFKYCTWTENVPVPVSGTMADEYPSVYAKVRSVVFSSGMTSLEAGVCDGCAALTEVRLPLSITSIATNAFRGCSSVTNICLNPVAPLAIVLPDAYRKVSVLSFPEGTSTFCDNAFTGCVALTSVVIPDSVSSLGSGTFAECKNLRAVVIESSSVDYGTGVFAGCPVPDVLQLPLTGVLSDIYPDNYREITQVLLPTGETEIVDNALNGCKGIESIDLPIGLTSIGSYAFANSGLKGTITLPENVSDMGSGIFSGCSSLNLVRYLGPEPTADAGLYDGTRSNSYYLASAVLKQRQDEWPSVATNENGIAMWMGRRVNWWYSGEYWLCTVTLDANGGTFDGGDATKAVRVVVGRTLDLDEYEPTAPSETFDTFEGWFTAATGGTRVEGVITVEEFVHFYAHWSRSDTREDPSPEDGLYGDEDPFAMQSSATFDAYLYDDAGVMSGTVTFSVAKGRYVASEEATNAAVKAKAVLVGSTRKIALSGTMTEGGEAELAGSSEEIAMTLTFGQNGVTGSFDNDGDSYTVSGARNLYSSKNTDDKLACKTALSVWKGNWNVVLGVTSAEGEGTAFANGYVTLSANIADKGKVKVTGSLPDGTKISSSSTLILGDGCACVPISLYNSRKGGLSFLLWLAEENTMATGLSTWISTQKYTGFEAALESVCIGQTSDAASCAATFTLGGEFELEGLLDEFLPQEVDFEMAGSRWKLPSAGKVKYDREAEAIIDVKDSDNPAALKLKYTAKTSAFSGSFKVYSSTDGVKLKTRSASVSGVMVDGFGYGTAYLKSVGSVPVAIETSVEEEEDKP